MNKSPRGAYPSNSYTPPGHDKSNLRLKQL